MVRLERSYSAPALLETASAPVSQVEAAPVAPKSYYDLKREVVMEKLTALVTEMQASPESLSIPQMFETQLLFNQLSQINAEEELNNPSRIRDIHNQILIHMARQIVR